MDEYRIISPGNVINMTPGVTPYFGNNPAFRVFTFSQDTLKAIDYTSLNYDLAVMPAQFTNYYTFSTAYGMQGFLSDSLTQLNPVLAIDASKKTLYSTHYFGGRPYTGNFTPINDANWPVYWAGIGQMDEQHFIDAVDSY